ncbi:MAG: septation protein A [Legionellaceae bacterium]|nr:septation protein A [Legionellaceae bacterium]
MKLLTDFLPIVLFFIGYKLFGIYIATAIAIIASLIQVLFYRLRYHRVEKIHLFSLAVISLLGGATLIFHDPVFIKWKPTGVYWISSLVFWGSMLVGQQPLIQKMMAGNIILPRKIWHRLNHAWAIFFVLMGFLNLYVAFNYSTDTWVNFKLFGGLGLTLVFVLLQALYLTRHIDEKVMRQES